MSGVTLLGYFAGLLTTTAFIPQVIKTWKAKSANDLSLLMFSIFTAGVLCWLAYGILLNEGPIIIWNIITLVLTGAILGMKLVFK